jgi:hypothetical protein
LLRTIATSGFTENLLNMETTACHHHGMVQSILYVANI